MATQYVEGLDELIKGTARINRGAAGEMRKYLRTKVGAAFVRDVKTRLSWSSGLPKTIRPRVNGTRLQVRSNPPIRAGKRSPGGYAEVYEFGGSNVRSVKKKDGSRGFSTVTNRSGIGAALAAGGAAQGSLGQFGPRAFLNPTLEDWSSSGRTEQELNGFLDWVEREFSR